MRGRRRMWLAATGWLIAAAAATTVGVVAVGAVGSSVVGTSTKPLTQQQIDRALGEASQSPSAQPPTAAPSTTPGGITRGLTTQGGTLIARCRAGQATLVSWSPAQGYQAEDIHAGPAATATLTFETENREIQVRVTCPAGIPTARTITRSDQDPDHD